MVPRNSPPEIMEKNNLGTLLVPGYRYIMYDVMLHTLAFLQSNCKQDKRFPVLIILEIYIYMQNN